MKSDERIIELLSDMLIEQKGTNKRLDKLEKRVDGLDKQQALTNLEIRELRHSIMKLADNLTRINEIDNRVHKLEHKVYGIT